MCEVELAVRTEVVERRSHPLRAPHQWLGVPGGAGAGLRQITGSVPTRPECPPLSIQPCANRAPGRPGPDVDGYRATWQTALQQSSRCKSHDSWDLCFTSSEPPNGTLRQQRLPIHTGKSSAQGEKPTTVTCSTMAWIRGSLRYTLATLAPLQVCGDDPHHQPGHRCTSC